MVLFTMLTSKHPVNFPGPGLEKPPNSRYLYPSGLNVDFARPIHTDISILNCLD